MASHLSEPDGRRGARRPARRPARRGGVVPLVIALVLLLAGGALLIAPSVVAIVQQQEMERALDAHREEVVEDEGATGDSDAQFRSKENDPTYQKLVEYNEAVREGTGDTINDPFAFSGEDLAELGLPDGIIGSIDIPSMGVSLPLYLGATYDNMAHGATVIAGTSMPIGGESNCVIAGHRGVWYGVPIFRDIEQMKVGDTLTITTPWDVLTYRAYETCVIDPSDVDAVRVQPGRDLVTLFTCHPYGHNYQRYLVYCERVDNAEAQPASSSAERVVRAFLPAPAADSPELTVEFVLKLVGLALFVVVAVMLVVTIARRARRRPRRE
ncbi:class C sortase [Olsenella uli]|uniref:class C sortase n=1 Tax=Olsenella uli TaxID=133926 RepID=UPI00195B5EA1|nr:class C sortase [Olsenella uli]MBM6676271.1 class C sortase [Olsenella uli]